MGLAAVTRLPVETQLLVFRLVASIVLCIEDVVPAIHKVSAQVFDYGATETDGNVGPSHAAGGFSVQLVLFPVQHVLKVEDSGIVVVLAGEHDLAQVGRMNIGNGVLIGIPASETKIESAHESNPAIDQAQLFMVGPEQDGVAFCAVECLDCITWQLRETSPVKGQVLERGN